MQIVRNAAADKDALYKEKHLAVVSLERSRRAEQLLGKCPLHSQTPLRSFDQLAARLGVGRILVKDESARLGLSSFKALGGAYAVMLRAPGSPFCEYPAANGERVPRTFATATDGNHGISVAAGAWLTGSRSVCFLPRHVERLYEDAMRLFGAKVIRIDGNYDGAVDQVGPVAQQNGWTMVSDTTQAPFDAVTRDVLSGYGVMVGECVRQLDEQRHLDGPNAVTHVFIQGGVGGLAAAFAGGLWQRLGRKRPTFVIVEPRSADCLFQSASHGAMSRASGDLTTSMSMLSCGRPSRMAWTILQTAAEFFMTIEDSSAGAAMEAYALEPATYAQATTPSGAAGLGGLIEAAGSREMRELIGLDENSVILTVCSERRPDRAALEALMSTRRQAVRV